MTLRVVYGELTATYGHSEAEELSVGSGNVRESMTSGRAGLVVFVSKKRVETTIVDEIEARGPAVAWARSIGAALELLKSAREKLVIVTELALADGNWRDLVQRVRCIDVSSPILLMTTTSTAELWWDALECGIDDILPGKLMAARLCQLLEAQDAS
jgi:DNA-binding response OmpR family regulator